jgi:Flp pilus assembly protein TadG
MNMCPQRHDGRHGERGVTMVLVAIAMVAIIAIAALSIDVVTLYLATQVSG